ncbi:MAG: PDDEXK nuclease domain-containing protein [Syntrophorhabdaceae bacterium]|nr:PDDEXK nuclease domain-containing protein [Syntrophorhabdaceae bacterium]MDD5243484.1 PDDEXK nuclease domain-containing protein [Syntrophorhabdaceae bacterium]
MNNWPTLLKQFLLQSKGGDLKTSFYPKEWSDLRLRISFGMGMPARIPWIAFITPEMQVSKGFYPVYLYYKELQALVLAYGISETEEFGKSWPTEIMNSTRTITAYFDQDVPRYGDSFVFKAYTISIENSNVHITYRDTNAITSDRDLESDLEIILDYYQKTTSITPSATPSDYSRGLFYMEKQLEDFLIHNWGKTEIGKRFDLIIEEGELISQQYKTDIGPIDILAKDKGSNSFVVIELKKDQTSDDTIGQVARYMGWIKEHKKDENVKGIIIAGSYDKKLDYALKVMKNIEVFLYEIDFKLKEFRGIE